MSRDIAPFGLRIPPELKSWLEQQAKNNGRSLNAEVIQRLGLMMSQSIAQSKENQNSLNAEVVRRLELSFSNDTAEKLDKIILLLGGGS